MINSFPKNCIKPQAEDFNPAIRTFGRRFSNDQQVLDLLVEFLLVFASRKKVIDSFAGLPSYESLFKWKDLPIELTYFPKAHLNLKLFSFLSSSRLETRHHAHREHGKDIWQKLSQAVDLETEEEKKEFLKTLSLLFLGFWGNGADRTWCAQTFFPFCEGVLGGDVIWNKTAARRRDANSWDHIIDNFSTFFDTNKHRFLARGGEVLFLQLCNALTKSKDEIEAWISSRKDESGVSLGFSELERDPQKLHAALGKDFLDFFALTPKALNEVMEFIDTGVDAETSQKSDFDETGEPRGVKCGWVPEESWREGYLFAVELHRILSANIGLIEKVELLETACALQLMRSLAAQSYRHSRTAGGDEDGFDYRALICDAASHKRKMKTFSMESNSEISREIQQAIRHPKIMETVYQGVSHELNSDKKFSDTYNEADTYGFKLYRKIGKSIGLIVPPTGTKVRYTLTDKLLKYLVVAMMPQKRMTLETFKKQIELHHGFVFELGALAASRNWSERKSELAGQEKTSEYLEQMLEASGTLVRLSDSCSLVKNPYIASLNGGSNR